MPAAMVAPRPAKQSGVVQTPDPPLGRGVPVREEVVLRAGEAGHGPIGGEGAVEVELSDARHSPPNEGESADREENPERALGTVRSEGLAKDGESECRAEEKPRAGENHRRACGVER